MYPWERDEKETLFFPQIRNSSPIMRKPQANPNWGTFYKTYEQLFQSVQVMKNKERQKLSQTKGD